MRLHYRIQLFDPTILPTLRQRILNDLANSNSQVSSCCLGQSIDNAVRDSINATNPFNGVAINIINFNKLTEITTENGFCFAEVEAVKKLSPKQKAILTGLEDYVKNPFNKKNHPKLTAFFAYLKNNP